MTEDVYGHLFERIQQEAAERAAALVDWRPDEAAGFYELRQPDEDPLRTTIHVASDPPDESGPPARTSGRSSDVRRRQSGGVDRGQSSRWLIRTVSPEIIARSRLIVD